MRTFGKVLLGTIGISLLAIIAFWSLEPHFVAYREKPQHREVIGLIQSGDFDYVCYFPAYSFGPRADGLESFQNEFDELTPSVITAMEGRFPVYDGDAFILLFNSNFAIKRQARMLQHNGLLRWRVGADPKTADACHSADDASVRVFNEVGFFVLSLELN